MWLFTVTLLFKFNSFEFSRGWRWGQKTNSITYACAPLPPSFQNKINKIKIYISVLILCLCNNCLNFCHYKLNCLPIFAWRWHFNLLIVANIRLFVKQNHIKDSFSLWAQVIIYYLWNCCFIVSANNSHHMLIIYWLSCTHSRKLGATPLTQHDFFSICQIHTFRIYQPELIILELSYQNDQCNQNYANIM